MPLAFPSPKRTEQQMHKTFNAKQQQQQQGKQQTASQLNAPQTL